METNNIKNDNKIVIAIIRRFLSLHHRILSKPVLKAIIEEIQTPIKSGKLTHSKVKKELQFIQDTLVDLHNHTATSVQIEIKPETKARFNKIVDAYVTKKDISNTPPRKPLKKKNTAQEKAVSELSGIEEHHLTVQPIMKSTDFVKLKFDTIGFKGKWLQFIGDPAHGFKAMVFGKPKYGKSTLCLEFAHYLAAEHGKVIYVAKEEQLDATLKNKIQELNLSHPNLAVTGELPEELSHYQYVFLDSVNKMNLSSQELEKLETQYPNVSFIYIFQTTKEGRFRGSNEYQHNVDIVIEVPEKGKALQNGRYNQGGEMRIFEDKKIASSEKKPTATSQTSILEGVKKQPEQPKKNDPKKKPTKIEQYKEIYKYASDEDNPIYLFSQTRTHILVSLLQHKLDAQELIRYELNNRGLDEQGKWVGFDTDKSERKS